MPTAMEVLRPEEVELLVGLQQPVTVEGAKLFNPSESAEQQNGVSPLSFEPDSRVLACIEYERKNSVLRQAVSSGRLVDDAVLQPVAADKVLKSSCQERPMFLRHGNSGADLDGSRTRRVQLPCIDEEVCRDAVVRAVATLSCLAGFQTSSDVILDVFADAAIMYLRQLCRELRNTRDMETLMGPHGFSDAVERTFADCRVGGVRSVLAHYQKHVVSRHVAAADEHQRLCVEYGLQTRPAAAAAGAADHPMSDRIPLEESLLEDILSETTGALQSVGPGGTIDMSAYPNMSFESAEEPTADAVPTDMEEGLSKMKTERGGDC